MSDEQEIKKNPLKFLCELLKEAGAVPVFTCPTCNTRIRNKNFPAFPQSLPQTPIEAAIRRIQNRLEVIRASREYDERDIDFLRNELDSLLDPHYEVAEIKTVV